MTATSCSRSPASRRRPRPLDGKRARFRRRGDRRVALAAWLTSPENPYFKRAIVNRVWANFFGVGLVEAVDDIRASNPASNEPLFTAAANFLVEKKFDLRALMRAILQSETYQRSSVALPENIGGHALLRALLPAPADGRSRARRRSRKSPKCRRFSKRKIPTWTGDKAMPFPVGWRAVQLPDANTDSYFTRAFGRAARENTCECERTAEPSVTQALHLANGDTINQKLSAKEGVISSALTSEKPPAQWIEEAYLAALSRLPTTAEQTHFAALFADEKTDRRPLLEDVYWALLTSREFLFNH